MSVGETLNRRGHVTRGGEVHSMSTAQGIFHRHKHGGSIATHDAWFSSLVAQSAVAVAVVDGEGSFIYASPSVTRLTGRTPEELLGTSTFAFLDPEHRDAIRSRFVAMIEEGNVQDSAEFRIRTKSGEWMWVEAIATNCLDDPLVEGIILNYHDITDRREAQEQLRRSQQLLIAAQEASHIGSFEWDMRTDSVSWSDEHYRIHGYVPGSIEVDHDLFIRGVHPEDRDRVDANLQKAIIERAPFVVEFRIKRADGTVRWIHSWGEFSFEDGSPVRLLGSTQDITDQRKARLATAALSDQQEELANQFRLLLDSTAEGICGVDEHDRCIFINRAAAKMLGYSPEELYGKNMHLAVHHTKADGSEYPEEECRIVRASRSGVSVSVHQDVFWRKDGSSFPIEFSSHPLMRDGDPQGAVVVIRDLSDRLKMETELRASEELLRGILDNSPAVIYVKSADGHYLICNQFALEMYGLSREEVIGHTDREIFPADVADAIEAADALAMLGETVSLEEQAEDINGQLRTFLSLKFPLMSPEGPPYALCGISTDITARVKLGEERAELETRLKQSQRMESIGQLAGGVAHDFNNILAVILNYADFIAEDLVPGDPRLRDVQEITKAGDKAAQLVQQLLTFSRKEVTEPEIVSLNEVIADLHEILSRSIGEDIELRCELDPELPSVKVDPGQLEQVLLNLAVNARDAMPSGGSLLIATGAESVKDHLLWPGLKAGEYVRMTVTDSGEGIDPEIADRIFEPFFTTKEREEGTGLGLSTVYGIVKQTGGGVYVESAVGKGTTFTVYIPVATEVPKESFPKETEPEAIASCHGGNGTILMVEDEDGVRSLVSRILSKAGFDVVAFSGGAEAVEYCQANLDAIDLLLTDVIMPEMSGKDLSDKLTLMRPGLTTLYMSGYTDEIIVQRGVLDPSKHLIQKPFKSDEIVTRIRSLLEMSPS
ncbi:MAG: PAS domain S-box protein [Actinobacteria bacterium]|nr:PAS domain S-box protein [Actinomycetota bacterium]